MQKLISIGIGLFLVSAFCGNMAQAQSPQPSEQGLIEDSSKTAAVPEGKSKAVPAKPSSGKESASSGTEKMEHNFEDLLVQGKYHFSDEAVTTVEEDKVLDSLLGVRTDFKDKIEQSVGRY